LSIWSQSSPVLGAHEEVERSRLGSLTGVPEDPRQNFREAVSDRGSGVRSRGETPARAPEEKGTTVMKLTTLTQITVDGVMQGNGPTDVDRGNGFERGGWAMGAGDNETRAFITQTYQRADAFLFGRRTYELFAGSWGAIEEMRAHPSAWR
jgi:hypothetical protein